MDALTNPDSRKEKYKIGRFRRRLHEVETENTLTALLLIAPFFTLTVICTLLWDSLYFWIFAFFPIFMLVLYPFVIHRRKKTTALRERNHWQKAFKGDYSLPLDLLIAGMQTLPAELNKESEQRLFHALTTSQVREFPCLSLQATEFLLRRLYAEKQYLLLLSLAEQYGEEEMLRWVRQFIKLGSMSKAVQQFFQYDDEVVERARRVFPIVEARIAMKKGETLLRPSEAPVCPETLLRPSEEKAETAGEELLRPDEEQKRENEK